MVIGSNDTIAGGSPPGTLRPPRLPVVLALLAAIGCGIAALIVVPRGIEAESILSIANDPVQIAERGLDQTVTPDVIQREIEAALAANDADLAKSFLDLAQDRGIAVDSILAEKVTAAVADANSTSHMAETFARGFVTGEPDDVVGLAGTALGDFFVFGDVRDAVREGSRMASGQNADELVLGLACVGLAITAGTYASFGAAMPARVGISVAKVARKTSRLSAGIADWMGRSLREVIDWPALNRAIAGASLTEPALAVRAAREAVKVEKAGGLMQLVRNVGRVQSKAGTQAALDGLKVAENPRELARVVQLAEKQGSKTRATLKLLGRGAIALSLSVLNLSWWILGAIFTLLGFIVSCKGAVERMTWRHLQKRKLRALQRQGRLAAAQVRP
jgi:hypothetical protein